MLALAALVILVLVGLAVGGVFGNGSQKPAGAPTGPGTTSQTTQANTTTPTTAPTTTQSTTRVRPPTTTLKLGDHGPQVTVLQRALKSLGYSAGKVDGQYGPSTQSAVTRFQSAAHLKPDGILGPATLAALTAALAAS